MAKARFGPPVSAATKWAFDVGSIVKANYWGVVPECDRDGVIIRDEEGHPVGSLSCRPATGVVIARVPSPDPRMFARMYEDGSPAPSDPICKCYVVMVLPERKIQVEGFMPERLGKFYLVRDENVSQTVKEKKLAQLGLWNHESGTFDRSRVRELADKVHAEEIAESMKGSANDDDR